MATKVCKHPRALIHYTTDMKWCSGCGVMKRQLVKARGVMGNIYYWTKWLKPCDKSHPDRVFKFNRFG